MNQYEKVTSELIEKIENLDTPEKVKAINFIRGELHKISPFKNEPVDFVKWIKIEEIEANDYNPNSVAPPEMELLAISVREDGYTQPIVAFRNDEFYEVIDGFHRNRIGKEIKDISERILGYLPLTIINENRLDRGDRITSTIRHNRARGKHRIDSMSEIVVELKRRNWSPKKIATELGMDQDEVLRLSQISGLAEMFADKEFTEAWEADILEESEIVEDFETLD